MPFFMCCCLVWRGELRFSLETGCGQKIWTSATCYGATGAHLHVLLVSAVWLCFQCKWLSPRRSVVILFMCTYRAFSKNKSSVCVYVCVFVSVCVACSLLRLKLSLLFLAEQPPWHPRWHCLRPTLLHFSLSLSSAQSFCSGSPQFVMKI